MRDNYSTRSLWCSAYLVLKGHELINFELVSPHNGYFIFKWAETTEEDVADFYTRDPAVPVRSYLDKYSELRSLVMKARREAGGKDES